MTGAATAETIEKIGNASKVKDVKLFTEIKTPYTKLGKIDLETFDKHV